jgi:hypothetical protein
MDKATRNYDSSPSGNVQKEVERLISEGKTSLTLQDYERLRRKYPDDNTLYEKVMEAFTERAHEVRRTARKFYNLIMKNVLEGSTSGHTLYSILSLAKRYASDNGLSGAEFEEFRRLVETKLSSGVDDQPKEDRGMFPSTNVTSFSKLLGTVAVESNNGLALKDAEYGVLQEIVRIYSMTRTLHASVIIQSMLHTDCSSVALGGRYDQSKHNPAIYINPLLFALFVPKFNSIDERMLLSNVAGVVKAKYNKESIATLPDYRLFYALVTDKNDVVCDSESPIKDLRNRVLLQQHLWNSVIAIRAGKYFDVTAAEFVSAVDNCKFSIYSPEVANMGDETVILKRLFAAFSFNPITVVSAPLYNTMSYNQYDKVGFTQEVYNVPYLQINVPPAQALTSQINITDCLNQTIYEFVNNTFVQRQRRVHSADEVIAISLSRKFRAPEVRSASSPFFVSLPLTINGYETINQAEVICPAAIQVGDSGDQFNLKSAVFAELMTPVVNSSAQQFVSTNEIVVGTSAIVKCGGDFYAYRPVLIHTPLIFGPASAASSSPVIRLVPGAVDANGNPDIDSNPSEMINKRGLVILYQKA